MTTPVDLDVLVERIAHYQDQLAALTESLAALTQQTAHLVTEMDADREAIRQLPAVNVDRPLSASDHGETDDRASVEQARGHEIDDLALIKGLDLPTAFALAGLGFTRWSDLAEMTASDARRIGSVLGTQRRAEFAGWTEQAAILANGGSTAYSRQRQANPSPSSETTAPAKHDIIDPAPTADRSEGQVIAFPRPNKMQIATEAVEACQREQFSLGDGDRRSSWKTALRAGAPAVCLVLVLGWLQLNHITRVEFEAPLSQLTACTVNTIAPDRSCSIWAWLAR